MTALIERGAIALLRKDKPNWEWNTLARFEQEPYLHRSRTCLEAFRETTDRMVVAGCRHENMGDMAGRWQAMVDAELDTDT